VSINVEEIAGHLRRCAHESGPVTTELAVSMGRLPVLDLQMVSTPVVTEGGETWFCTALLDVTALRESERRLRYLSDLGESLGRSFGYEAVLEDVVRSAVPLLSDLCVLDAEDPNGESRRIAVAFADAEKQARFAEPLRRFGPWKGAQTPEGRARASGRPTLFSVGSPDALAALVHDGAHAALLAEAGVSALMVVPLVARGHTLGVLSFAAAESRRSFGARELAFAEDVGRRIAIAMDNARLYEQAQRAVRARDSILAVVSHDLRTPLGAIVMTAAQLLDSPAREERRTQSRRAVDAIHRAAQAMNRMIGDLVDVASLDAGRFSIERRAVSSEALVVETLAMMRPFADRAGITLTLSGPASDVTAWCDRQRIIQVLANLVANAIKFTRRAGTVTLRAEVRLSEVRFVVIDTGAGISEGHLPRIFDRFWQARETAHLGTGLGLSIAKAIVEAHGGRIWAESRVGVGSTFFVTVPRMDRSADA
jgi:signal transduction histidine kinase